MESIGIIAGNGILPLELVKHCNKNNIKVYVIAHVDETDPAVEQHAEKVKWIKLGKLGQIISFFKSNKISNCVMIGGIKKVSAFSARPDWRTLKLVLKLKTLNDDELLRGIAKELENEGIKISGCQEFLPELLPSEGQLTSRGLTEQETVDANIGIRAAKMIGMLDIGQSVFVKRQMVIAVEAIEGTDAAIQRAGSLNGRNKDYSITMVKFCKPNQDLRLDLPSIGVNTIKNMHENKISALVVTANQTLFLEPQEIITHANKLGIAIISLNAQNDCI